MFLYDLDFPWWVQVFMETKWTITVVVYPPISNVIKTKLVTQQLKKLFGESCIATSWKWDISFLLSMDILGFKHTRDFCNKSFFPAIRILEHLASRLLMKYLVWWQVPSGTGHHGLTSCNRSLCLLVVNFVFTNQRSDLDGGLVTGSLRNWTPRINIIHTIAVSFGSSLHLYHSTIWSGLLIFFYLSK